MIVIRTCAAALAVAALAACSSSGGGSGGGSSRSTSPAGRTASPAGASSTAASTRSSAAPAASGCDRPVVDAVKKALVAYPSVGRVMLIGGCHEVSLETTLESGDPLSAESRQAMAICRAASKVAYRDAGVSSVSVDWRDRNEAATGLRTKDCIPG